MKLRRSLAAVAATAVIAPAALLAAPAAFATDGAAGVGLAPSPSPSPSVSAPSSTATETSGTENAEAGENGASSANTPEGTPGSPESSATGASGTEESEETGSEETGSEETGAEESESESESGKGDEPGATTPSATTPSESSPPATTSPTPSPTPSVVEDCEAAGFRATMSGLPRQIVAGSGWQHFSLSLDNSEGEARTEATLGAVLLYKKDAHGEFVSSLASEYAQIQYFDGEQWTSHLSSGGQINGVLDIGAGETVTLEMRLRIKASAPAGSAVGIAFGVYVDDKTGTCYADERWYSFDVLAAGTELPAEGNDNKPQQGKPPVKVRPVTDTGTGTNLTGNLAATGSSSQLPVIALIGGITVVAGAGVVFAVRRRKGDGGE